jgi:nicotinamide-nucleotide amidase
MAEPRVSRAAIVSVGNELLYGQTVDTNAAWLGRVLAQRGIPVARRYTVGDVDADIREAFDAARMRADLVLVSGGLGPTPDDRTKPVLAAHLGRRLVPDEEARRDVEARFRAAGMDAVPPLSRGQYEVPEGARVLRNPKGTAPGLLLSEGDCTVVLLPGVPYELKAIVEGALLPVLDTGAPREGVHHRVVHTTGIFETKLAEALEPRLAALPEALRDGIDLAYLPDLEGVDLRFTTRAKDARTAQERLERLVEALGDVLGPWRFESEAGDMAEATVRALRRGGRTLAVGESCTGGLVSKRLTDVAGASDVFLGGVIAYSNASKVRDLGVSDEDLARHGAVSEPVARQLACGVAERFGADAGVGVTGVAGPDGGSAEKPVGTVWIGVYLDGEVGAFVSRFPGDRESVRARAAQAALAALYRRLLVAGEVT